MNWPGTIYGSSLLDYPNSSVEVIEDAEEATATSLQELCCGRRIFLTPIQANPLNVTAGLLAERCHSHWLKHYFGKPDIQVLKAGMVEAFNPLSRVSGVVSSAWVYQ
jgi:hypothetical protein